MLAPALIAALLTVLPVAPTQAVPTGDPGGALVIVEGTYRSYFLGEHPQTLPWHFAPPSQHRRFALMPDERIEVRGVGSSCTVGGVTFRATDMLNAYCGPPPEQIVFI